VGIPEIAAPYKIDIKEMLLQAAAVVTVIQDKLRGDKNNSKVILYSEVHKSFCFIRRHRHCSDKLFT
jgi:hypothetical protein